MSRLRKIYFVRLFGRCVVLLVCTWHFHANPSLFNVLNGMNFFRSFTLLHILWIIWMIDMLSQVIPIQKSLSIGSKKLFRQYFRPTESKIDFTALKEYIVSTTKSACQVLILWGLLTAALGFLRSAGILNAAMLLLISVIFYVCDLICVLIWCPFRLLLKNRCCTTCRIFNWDHIMMFTPMAFVSGFYARSLLFMSILVWIAWELCVFLHPERFWDKSNASLQCTNCTDKLCTQYCRKLRSTRSAKDEG